MENYKVILGVDVSKLTLDISCAERKLHLKIENDSKGFRVFKSWCKTNDIKLNETLIVMEHTGGYEYKFLQFCESIPVAYCRISGLEIKRSMGMTRGKSDKVDSFRIGQYGEERIKRLKPSNPLDHDVLSLKQLLSFRKRLVRENSGLMATIKEREHLFQVNKKDSIIYIAKQKLKSNQKHLQQIEEAILILIKTNSIMYQNYKILTSINQCLDDDRLH